MGKGKAFRGLALSSAVEIAWPTATTSMSWLGILKTTGDEAGWMAGCGMRRGYDAPSVVFSLAERASRARRTGAPQAFNDEMRLGGEIGDCGILETGREKFSTAREE